MLHLTRRVAFRVNIGKLLELQRAFQGYRVKRSTAKEKYIPRLGHFRRHGTNFAIAFQNSRGVGGHFQQRCGQFRFLLRGEHTARTAKANRQACQYRKLRRECLGGSHANFRPRHGQHRRIAFTRHGAFRHIHNGKHALAAFLQ